MNHWFSYNWGKSLWFQFASFFPWGSRWKALCFLFVCFFKLPVQSVDLLTPAWAKLLKWGKVFSLFSTVSSSPHTTGDTAYREGGWLEFCAADQMEKVHYRQHHQLKSLSHIRESLWNQSKLLVIQNCLLFRVGKDLLSHLLTCGNCWIIYSTRFEYNR